jgi:1-hydroxycarotenoid 3,4-desaturase
MASGRVVVIGAGIAGLVAALRLAAEGLSVTVVERQAAPGGKMREEAVGTARIDAGPTVFTMRWIFEEILEEVGESLTDHVSLARAEVLARHAWGPGERLDLFADRERSAAAIADFAGPADAKAYLAFTEQARRVFETLDRPFMRAERPSRGLVSGVGFFGLPSLWSIRPFTTLWSALGSTFRDPRLRQLFGRYATYCGSSPFIAPATLMLVAHVEQEGVWLVEGGMHRLAQALAGLAKSRGADFRYGAEAREILCEGGRVAGVRLDGGEHLPADAAILNADVNALAGGLFGAAATRAASGTAPDQRSLSAVTFAMVARTEGFPLLRHNVFFSGDYAGEFDDLLMRRQLPREPTTYVCAQDRGCSAADLGEERLLCLVNAPATGDLGDFSEMEIERCRDSMTALLERCGLRIRAAPEAVRTTTPAGFERLFPATGGALYGRASHGWMASFDRPAPRTRLPGLYLAGGSVHPGPGIPMAALSGRTAARCALADLASTARSRPAVMSGGMSTG